MDREGDSIENLALLLEHEQYFVIRLTHNPRLEPGRKAQEYKLFEALRCAPIFLEREVVLSEQKKAKGKTKAKSPSCGGSLRPSPSIQRSKSQK